MKRILLILFAVLLLLCISGLIFIRLFVDGERVARYSNDLLGDEYEVQVLKASLNPFSRTLSLQGITVYFVDDENREELFQAEIITVQKISLRGAIQGRAEAEHFLVEQFYLNQSILPDEMEGQNGETGGTELFLKRAELKNGEILFRIGGDGSGEIQGLNFSVSSLRYMFGCSDCEDNLSAENIRMEIPETTFTFWEGRYQFTGKSFLISEEDSLVEAERLTLKPTLSEEDFFDSLEYRTDLFSVDLSGFSISKFDLPGFRSEDRFSGEQIALDSLDLYISFDKRVPRDPDRTHPPMPLEALQNLPFETSVDTLRVYHADIRYAEYDEEGVRPGIILFAGIDATIAPLHSHSPEPVVLTANCRLERSGELNTEIRFSMADGVSVTEVKGSLGRFDVTRLNNIFEDLEGIRIRDGEIQRVDFQYVMRGKQANGLIWMHYDDLSIELINRDNHERGFRNRVAGFLMDRIAIRSSSENNGEDFRRGEISEEQEPEKGFFNYLWVSLRSGIMDIVRRV
jgi:hypothetical protein